MSKLYNLAITLAVWLMAVSANADIYVVTTTSDTGTGGCDAAECTLREAITAAEAHPNGMEKDEIHFSVPGMGAQRIVVSSLLPTITEAVIIDGYTQPGAQANTKLPTAPTDAVLLIELSGGDTVLGYGLRIVGDGSVIRGLSMFGFKAVNSAKIDITGNGNAVQGCYLGLDAAGTTVLENDAPSDAQRQAINVTGTLNLIGGALPAERNVIARANTAAIRILGGTFNVIQGNFVGTTADGAGVAKNAFGQTVITNMVNIASAATSTVVGGSTFAAANYFCGAHGVIDSGDSTIVQRNYLYVQRNGVSPCGERSASYSAVLADAASNDLRVEGNVIGVTDGARYSVNLSGSTDSKVVENFIGVTPDGFTPILREPAASVCVGVYLLNQIRGLVEGNTILPCKEGIIAFGSNVEFQIVGNYIGVSKQGVSLVSSRTNNAIQIDGTSSGIIGGELASEANVIANTRFGIYDSSTGIVPILGNLISNTSDHAIELVGGGETNDTDDVDSGPNGFLNFPDIQRVTTTGASTTASVVYQGLANETFRLEFFSGSIAPPKTGNAPNFLEAVNITTDGDGNATLNQSLQLLPPGVYVTATASLCSDAGCSSFEATSQFSPSFQVAAIDSDGDRVCVPNGVDTDLDGLCVGAELTEEVDCDDDEPLAFPQEAEGTCGDSIDNDCDVATDLFDTDCTDDLDGDSYCVPSGRDIDESGHCETAAEHTADVDCDDLEPLAFPQATEDISQCGDGIDNDCDTIVDLSDSDCEAPCASDSDCDVGNDCIAATCGSQSKCEFAAKPASTLCSGGVCDGGFPVAICITCNVDADCPSDSPKCDPVDAQCVGCLADTDCSGGQTCNLVVQKCVSCVSDGDCVDGNDCTLNTCNSGSCTTEPAPRWTPCGRGSVCDGSTFTCAPCLVDANCPAATPICSTGQCVGCAIDMDCLSTQTCSEGECVGEALTPDADGDTFCVGGRDRNLDGDCDDLFEQTTDEDCDDTQISMFPRAGEPPSLCEDGLDNDCDTQVDGADSDCQGLSTPKSGGCALHQTSTTPGLLYFGVAMMFLVRMRRRGV